VSCHLNDTSTKKRDAELKNILDSITKNASNAIFLGGDLNYRPVYEEIGLPEGDVVYKELLADMNKFYKAHDLFGQGKAALVATHKMTFPDPTFMPTYKRNTKGSMTLPSNPKIEDLTKFYSLPEAKGVVVTDADGNPIKFDYKTAGEVKEKRRGEYAIGWLDRIGYKAVKDVTIADAHFGSCPSCLGGDHTPVFLSTKVSFDPGS
jgi:hypothetical protein